jgi:hypothetical protein
MANIIHTFHVGFDEYFSSIENVMGCSSKLSSCTPKEGSRDTLNHKDSRVLKSHGLLGFI